MNCGLWRGLLLASAAALCLLLVFATAVVFARAIGHERHEQAKLKGMLHIHTFSTDALANPDAFDISAWMCDYDSTASADNDGWLALSQSAKSGVKQIEYLTGGWQYLGYDITFHDSRR